MRAAWCWRILVVQTLAQWTLTRYRGLADLSWWDTITRHRRDDRDTDHIDQRLASSERPSNATTQLSTLSLTPRSPRFCFPALLVHSAFTPSLASWHSHTHSFRLGARLGTTGISLELERWVLPPCFLSLAFLFPFARATPLES